MNFPLSKKILSVVLASVLVSPLLPAHANESVNNQTVSLDKLAYFLTPGGDNIQLQPGSYQIDPTADSLQVSPTDKKTPSFELAITMDTHDQDLPEPMAVSVPGLPETDSSDRHVLALLLPGGLVYEATGTYSGIRSRDIDPQSLITDPLDIYLEKPVHFLTPDGKGLEVQPGTYSVERVGEGIRLVTPEKKEGLLLEAHPAKDESDLDTSVALSLPGEAEEEADLHYIVLMTPTGESLQALGTYSGIHQRGVFNNFAKKAGGTINRARRNVNRVGQGARRTTQQIAKGMQQTAQDAGRFAQKTALEAKKAAEWTARQAAQGALIAAKAVCKAGLTAAQITAQVKGKLLGPIKKILGEALGVPKAQVAMQKAIQSIIQRNGEAIGRIIEAAMVLTDPKNFNAVKNLMNPNEMCEQPANTVQTTFKKMIGKPMQRALAVAQSGNDSKVRTRGSLASAYMALALNAAKVGGAEVGGRWAFDFVNKSHIFIDVAGQIKTLIGGGVGVELGFLHGVNPVDTGGWFTAVSLGTKCKLFFKAWPDKIGCGLTAYFSMPIQFEGSILKPNWAWNDGNFWKNHFLGLGVSAGVDGGKSLEWVSGAIKAGYGIRVSKK